MTPDTITTEDGRTVPLDGLEEAARAATAGPRRAERLRDNHGKTYATLYETHIFVGPSICGLWAPEGRVDREADAAHIAAFDREVCLALVAEVRRLRDELERAEVVVNGLANGMITAALEGEHPHE